MALMQMEALSKSRRERITTTDTRERKAEFVPLGMIQRRVDRDGTEENLTTRGKVRTQLAAWSTAWENLYEEDPETPALKDINEGELVGSIVCMNLVLFGGARSFLRPSIPSIVGFLDLSFTVRPLLIRSRPWANSSCEVASRKYLKERRFRRRPLPFSRQPESSRKPRVCKLPYCHYASCLTSFSEVVGMTDLPDECNLTTETECLSLSFGLADW